jgi:glycosyltransferase involved in cell wall biosynthesis
MINQLRLDIGRFCMDTRRVIAIQQGARRNYFYARQLEAAGLLNYLGCDAAWPEGHSKWLLRLIPRLSGAARRRSIIGIPSERICASLWPNAAGLMKYFVEEEQVYDLKDEALAWRLRLRGLDGADVVLNYFGNGGSFLRFAKQRGAKVITDFIISPKGREMERRERAAWPGWDSAKTSQTSLDVYRRRFVWLLGLSDLYLCPSHAVAEDLAELPGFDAARVRIVPYGSSGVLKQQPRPEPGRVLFAGSDPLRKGLPYLAQAASILKEWSPEVKIVVAGAMSVSVRQRPETKDLHFLGHLDREAMALEFARADVFCLPSLAEGSPTAIFEALAYALPVVTTHASGSVVRDGVEGLIVPPCDGAAIAASIAAIVGDRDRRSSMSAAASASAMHYDETHCGEAFIRAVRECLASPPISLSDRGGRWNCF